MTEPKQIKIFLNQEVDEALSSYLNAKNLNHKTISKYMEFYRKFANRYGELNQQNLDEFLKYNDYSSARAMAKHLLRAISRWDFPQEMKGLVFKLDIPKRTGKKKEKTPLHMNFKELEYLIENMKGDSITTKRNKLAFQTQWWAGLRISELLGITIDDLLTERFGKEKNFQQIKISSETAKYGKEGVGYIPTELYVKIVDYIKERIKISQNFANSLNQGENIWGYKKSAYSKALNKNTRRILGRSYNTHSLRHGRATDLIKKDVEIEKVKEILRHKDISTTQKYVHLDKEEIEESLR